MSIVMALDGMGGDDAPGIVVRGAALALAARPDLRFVLVGDERRLVPLLAAKPHGALATAIELVHTTEHVAGDAKPSVALRQGRQTSMRLAIDAVKAGRAQAAVSAGNTGALMAMAKVVLRTLPGIDRPAICGVWPAKRNPVVGLDLGANIETDPQHLVQFAVMGAVYARTILGVAQPRVGLLNVGTEEAKGGDRLRAAAALLRGLNGPFIFHGFVEGDEIVQGGVDVVVTDGFTGNVALKVAEGTARLLQGELREAFGGSWRGRLGYLVARPALARLRDRFDPRLHNGAMFLGAAGVVVKSHGGTDAVGFANAVQVAARLVAERTNERITAEIATLAEQLGAPALTAGAA